MSSIFFWIAVRGTLTVANIHRELLSVIARYIEAEADFQGVLGSCVGLLAKPGLGSAREHSAEDETRPGLRILLQHDELQLLVVANQLRNENAFFSTGGRIIQDNFSFLGVFFGLSVGLRTLRSRSLQ